MSQTPEAPLLYRGFNRHGMGVVGRCQTGQSAANAAREFYERGFRQLTITRDGVEVGGVGLVGKKRTWWGENGGDDAA